VTTPVGSIRITAEADAGNFGDDILSAVREAMTDVVREVTQSMGRVETALNNISGGAGFEDVAEAARSATDDVGRVGEAARDAAQDIERVDPGNLGRVGAEARDAAEDLGRIGNSAREATQDLGRVSTAAASDLGRVGSEARDAADDVERIGAAANESEGKLGGLRGAASSAAGGISGAFGDAAGGIEVAGLSVDDLMGKIGKLGPVAGAAAAAVAVAFAGIAESIASEDMAAKFKVEFDLIGEEAVRANEIAKTVFRGGYGESMEAVLSTVGEVHQALVTLGDDSPGEIEKLVKSAENLQTVFGIETAESIQLVSQLIRNGLAKDATEGFDLVTTAFGRTNKAMRDELPDLINEYGVFFDSMGFSGQEAFGALIAASNEGQIAMDKMGDAIKEFGIRATDLGDTGAVEALDALGLAGENIQNRLLAGGEVAGVAFKQINDALLAIPDDAKRAELGVALFGTPLEDLSKSKIPGFLESLKGAGNEMAGFEGSAARADETLTTTGAKLTSFGRTLKGGITDGLKVVGAGLIEFGGNLYEGAIKPFGEKLGPAFEKAKEILSDVWENTIKPIFEELRPQIEKLAPAFEVLGNIVGTAFSLIGSVVGVAWDIIAPILRGAFTVVGELIGIIGSFASFLLDLPDTISGAFDAVVGFFTGLPEMLGDLASTIGDWFAEQWEAFTGTLGELIDGAASFFTELPGKIVGWLGDLAGIVGGWFSEQWENVKALFGLAVDGISFIFTELPGKIVGWIGDIAGVVGDFFAERWEVFKGNLGLIVDGIQFVFTELPGKVIGWIGDIGGTVGNWFSQQWDTVTNFVSTRVDNMVNNFKALPGRITSAVSGLWDGIKDTFRGTYNAIAGWWNGLSLTLGPITLNIPDWLPGPDTITLGPYVLSTPDIPTLAEGGIAGRRADGTIYGPGTGKSDSILGIDKRTGMPTAFVSTGERVLSIEEVAMLKRLLPGFADGGTVGGSAADMGPMIELLREIAENTGLLTEIEDEGPSRKASISTVDLAQVDAEALAEAAGGFAAVGEAAQVTTDEQIVPSITAINDGMMLTGATTAAVADEQIVPAFAFIGEQTAALGALMGDTINGQMIPAAIALGQQIQTTQSQGIQPAFDAIQGGLVNVQGAFSTGVNAIGATWEQLRAKTDAPVRFTVDNVFNKGLVGVWNHVSDFIGTDKMSTFSYASGGVTPGFTPGRDVHKFISPTGGRLELSGGEAIMVPEFTAAMGPDWVYRMNQLARARGPRAVLQAMSVLGDGPQRFADGGVWNQLWGAVQNKFPGVFSLTSSYRAGDPGHHGTGNAVDVSNGTDTTPQMQELARWIYTSFGKSALELIHYPLNGWQNLKNGQPLDYGATTNSEHRNHVHWAANGLTGGAAGPAYGPAFSMSDMVKEQAAAKWAEVEPDIKAYAAANAGMISAMPAESLGVIKAATDKKIEELAKEFDVPAGVGVERFRGLVTSLLANYGHPAGWVENTLRRMMQESGGDQNALNDWDENWQRGTPSVGLMQVIGPTYQANKDPKFDTGPYLYNTSTAPPANISASMRYTMATYGSLPAGYDKAGGYFMGGVLPLGLFDSGGVFRSGSAAVNGSGQPERVLSPEQTRAFDDLVAWLSGGQMTIDWGNVESLIKQGIEIYQAEYKKDRPANETTAASTKSIAREVSTEGSLGRAVASIAELSGDLFTVLDTSALFDGRTITLTAEEVRQKQIEEWQKFLDSLKAENEKSKTSEPAPTSGSKPKTYDLGGIISGPGLFASNTTLPERVLSPEQTAAFDALVGYLTAPQVRVPGLVDRNGAELRPSMTAGDIHFTINEARSGKQTGKVVKDHLLSLIDR
jgi:SLT domain-containing protein